MSIFWSQMTIDGERPLNRTAHNIRAELSLIEDGGEIVRLANGKRRSLRRRQFDLYRVVISGRAVRKPALDHLRKGDVVELGCPAHIDLPGDVADADLPRPPVPGSIFRFGEKDGRPAPLEHGDPDVRVTSFRPLLRVMIDSVEFSDEPGSAEVAWSFSAEEEG